MSDWSIPLSDLYNKMGDSSAKEWVDKKTIEILTEKRKWILFNVLSWLLVIMLFICKPICEEWHIWFSRFGSVICLMSVLIEYYFLNKFSNIISFSEHNYPVVCVIYIQRKFKSYVRNSKIYTMLVLILGTVIWGYGDLIFLQLTM